MGDSLATEASRMNRARLSLTPCFSGVLRGIRVAINRFNGFGGFGSPRGSTGRLGGKPLKRFPSARWPFHPAEAGC